MLLMLLCGQVVAETRIGTWNLQHLNDRPSKDFKSIAKVAKNVDFLAVQELVNKDALDKLAKELSRQSGEPWSAMASDAVGRASSKEMYGFVWKDSKVAYEDGAVSYLDRQNIFAREPYSARFKSLTDNAYFVVATVHIVYGKKPADRFEEIEALSSYWGWLKEVYPGNNHIMLMGDFNIAPLDTDVWDINDFVGATHVSEPERQAFEAFEQIGLTDVVRPRIPEGYTYWDYQQLRFPKNEGMRIDFILGNEAFEELVSGASIHRDERKGDGPSDHVPVVVDLVREGDEDDRPMIW